MADQDQRNAHAIEEGRNSAIRDRERTERWAERNEAELKSKNDELRQKLESAGLTTKSLAEGASLGEASADVLTSIQRLTERVELALAGDTRSDAETDLQLAKSYSAQRKWALAAERLDMYVAKEPGDFDIQFMRGTAHANSRQNNMAALRAFNEAIVVVESQTDRSRRARAFIHRGAVFKRLGRLTEAMNDITMGRELAVPQTYEAVDAAYNLACVFALEGKREQMLKALGEIPNRHKHWKFVRSHLHDYFAAYADDKDFLALLR
jgi:hypothetical protein